MSDDRLKSGLLDIHTALAAKGLNFYLGGGYGIYLKQTQGNFGQTIIEQEFWPVARSTDDLDLLLTPEIIISSTEMDKFRACVDEAGFNEIDRAKYFQFQNASEVKIDLLAGPVSDEHKSLVEIKVPRIKARSQKSRLHAYYTEEVIGLHENPYDIIIAGKTSKGIETKATIVVPNSFTYLVMKLHALDDQKSDNEQELGRHHALDIFRIFAMLEKDEYDQCREIARKYCDTQAAKEGSRLANTLFADNESIGSIRLQEHPLYAMDAVLRKFLKEFKEFFEDIRDERKALGAGSVRGN